MLRTHTCGELRKNLCGQSVTLCGWVDTRRDHGGLIFIDLRDRWGKTQLVFNPKTHAETHRAAEKLRSEYVIQTRGKISPRPAGTVNPKLATGEIEVLVEELAIFNESQTPPFEITEHVDISEDIRLKYRYLDIRRRPMLDRLLTRYHISRVVRDYLGQQGFAEIETPNLTKSTPEGSRDYLVPARLAPGSFYALPQSPQLFKQILMISGIDRYFQLARCFRDEDLRADRQPEHTQIDIEMSFISEEDIVQLIEGMLKRIFEEVLQQSLQIPFLRMSFEDAMNRYGTDKPDLRYQMLIRDASAIFQTTQFKVIGDGLKQGHVVKGIGVAGKSFSRSEFDELTEFAKSFGAKGLIWIKIKNANGREVESPIAKFLSPDEISGLIKTFELKDGDTLFLVSGAWEPACIILGELRKHLAARLQLIPKNEFRFLWVTNFPLLEWSEDEKRWQARHHPFTSPKEADLELLERDPGHVQSRAYDVVLNGTEIGGGSIRIHSEKVQQKMFQILGIAREDAEIKFGFLLKALKFGAPPHGGIAVGLDRLTTMLLGLDSIRDVIAFPKTQKGTCPMTEAPSPVTEKQLKELNLKVLAKPPAVSGREPA